MKTQRIGDSDLTGTRLSYGCMRIAGTWNPAEITEERRLNAHDCVIAAYEAGYTLFDHADIYCRGGCESLHGEVLAKIPSMRSEILIATKCGIRFKDDTAGSVNKYDFSYDHIIRSCEGSLKRLGIETIDIYQLHRPDVLMNSEEVARAFQRLHHEGKVRYFGVSNFFPSQLEVLQAALPHQLVVNQVEISLLKREPFFDGTLDQCLQKRITPLSWGPLAGGRLGNADDEAWKRLEPVVTEIAKAHGVGMAEVAIAWLLKHPSEIMPIVGSANPDRIRSLVRADYIELTREQWYALLVAAQGFPMP